MFLNIIYTHLNIYLYKLNKMNYDNSEFTSTFFDESSKEWMKNKIRKGSGYIYRCNYIHSNKRQCSKAAILNEFCKQHYFLLKKNLNK
jgi:hypothetical protein